MSLEDSLQVIPIYGVKYIYIFNYHGICAIYRIKPVKPASKIIGFRAGNTVCKGYNLFCVCNDQECWVKMSWQLNML